MVKDDFRFYSLLLESLLDNVGVECRSSNGDLMALSEGRFLWMTVQNSGNLLDLFSTTLCDFINQHTGDRFTEYVGYFGNCTGSNAHQVAATVLFNLSNLARRTAMFPQDESKHWNRLSAADKRVVQGIEESFNRPSLELCDLATKVRIERKLVSVNATNGEETKANQDHDAEPPNGRQEQQKQSSVQSLPFGLQLCDVEQSLKRIGYRQTITIQNREHWQFLEALMAAAPNAVAESKFKHLNMNRNDRDNYSRALKMSLSDLGLTVKRMALVEDDT